MANPRPANKYGHVIELTEGGDPAATTFRWDIFLLCGPTGDPTRKMSELPVFVSIQHPGENGDLAEPQSLWPDYRTGYARPSVVWMTKPAGTPRGLLMAGLGVPELVILLLVVVLLFGGAKLPQLVRAIGSAKRQLESASRGEDPGDR